jgi:ABC-type lipopolysaccharide export system ATPase subunit
MYVWQAAFLVLDRLYHGYTPLEILGVIIFTANLLQQLILLYIEDSGHNIRPIYGVAVTVYIIHDFWLF